MRRALLALISTGVTLLSAHPAAAAVIFGRSQIVVTGPSSELVISRRPFRLALLNLRRRPVLTEVPNHRPAPAPLAPTFDPVPPGFEPARSGQLYAPLSFLVGSQRRGPTTARRWRPTTGSPIFTSAPSR